MKKGRRSVSLFEAKTNLSSLVNDVMTKNEEVVITKHGHEVAKLIPIQALQSLADRVRAIDELEALAAEIGETGIGQKEIREMRSLGRK